MSSEFTIPINENVFRIYAITASVLVAKMLIMSPMTSLHRLRNRIYANPEDATYFDEKKDGKIIMDDPDVERVRRAHRNDLESILPYFLISALYTLSNPCPWFASIFMIVYTVCRIGHTYVYAWDPQPQPARVIFWGIGYAITFLMTGKVFLHFVF